MYLVFQVIQKMLGYLVVVELKEQLVVVLVLVVELVVVALELKLV